MSINGFKPFGDGRFMRVDADPVNGCACLIGIGILLFAGNFKPLAVQLDQIDIDDIAFASVDLDGGFVVVEDMLAGRVLFIGRLGQGMVSTT